MDEKGIKQFYSDRVPLTGRLSDYALLIGQNNRVLSYKSTVVNQGTTVNFTANRNRVALVVTGLIGTNVQEATGDFTIDDVNGVRVLRHTVYAKVLDVANTTLVQHGYWPLKIDILTLGPGIQGNMSMVNPGNGCNVVVTETFMTPICCEYIGGMK